MNLQTYQRTLAGLIRGTYEVGEDDDGAVKSIADSLNLEVAREIVRHWRQLGIERRCRLTASGLHQLGLFEEETVRFISKGEFSPYVEELGSQFLSGLLLALPPLRERLEDLPALRDGPR